MLRKFARTRSRHSAFTLVEILIVVIILGILAAIVIPQFTNASSGARRAATVDQLHTLRSQIQLYKLQHNDQIPDLLTDWTPLTTATTVNGKTFGPYLQAAPKNSLVDPSAATGVADGDGSASIAMPAGFIYDSSGGTGKIWATDTNGMDILDETAQ